MNRKLLLPTIGLAVILLFIVLLATNLPDGFGLAQPVVGKGSAVPLTGITSPQQQLAQELALADAQVLHHTSASRSEVFGVRDMMGQFTPASRECETAVCYQVEIYNFDRNAAITAIVDVEAGQVRDVLYLENAQPGINKRLADLAIDLARNDPQIIEALGYRPYQVDVAPVTAGMVDTNCDGRHLCVATVFRLPTQLLWAVIDLTTEEVAGVAWTDAPPESPQTDAPFLPAGCPAPGTVERDGWSLTYQTTGTDGLRVHTVTYEDVPVINNVKLVEWHVDYGSTGFVDIIGCGGGGGGFQIYPYGETEVLDLLDEAEAVIGFEVVQDFRMSNWGNSCNYRYDQRLQFFNDGRFRVVSGAYGRGCHTSGVYRPVVRIDVALSDPDNNRFATWDGSAWQTHQEEFWQLQDGPYTDEGYKWLLYDPHGVAYYLEPGQGQFGDSDDPDNAYLYVTMYRPEEGDTDLPVIGTCCNDDHRQGPHNFVDGDPVENQNIVIWYVPQMVKDGTVPDAYNCWTVAGEPNPETYPCFSGPMFVPAVWEPESSFNHNGPIMLGQTAVFTATSVGLQPHTHEWDFGDGLGRADGANPTYLYQEVATYTVALTTTAANNLSHTITGTIAVHPVPPITATFGYDNPLLVGEVITFVNESEGDNLTYLWDFGDGITSTLTSPAHSYGTAGSYTVILTITDGLSERSTAALIDVGHVRAELTAAAGAELGYSEAGQHITVTVPAQVVTETVTILYTAVDWFGTAVGPPFTLYGRHGLALTVYTDSLRLPYLPLAGPFDITFVYDDTFPDRLAPDTLRWAYGDMVTGTWQEAADTCEPPSEYQYDPDANRFSLAVCSLGRLALFGEPHNRVYLPAITR